MNNNFQLKYIKYKKKYLELKNQKGGYVNDSYILKIINTLNIITDQSPAEKNHINNKITNTGHGSIFLGSSSSMEGGDKDIRILVAAQYTRYGLKMSLFGGKCDAGEKTINTMIRETIEEIFNFKPSREIILSIESFIISKPDIYFIHKMENSDAYSYVFDVSILGDFIEIINSINNGMPLIIPYPNGRIYPLISYLSKNKYSDESSVHGKQSGSSYNTIDLIKFMKERYIDNHRKMPPDSLNEIKFLSFPRLNNINRRISSGTYDIYNSNTKNRETIEIERIFLKILTSSLNENISHAINIVG